jgi:chromatin remodeling complex protein RSC6
MASKTSTTKTTVAAPKVARSTKKAETPAVAVVAPVEKKVVKSKAAVTPAPAAAAAPVAAVAAVVETPAPVDDKKLVTSEGVVGVVNNVVLQLKGEVVNAKARKDREAASTLNDAIKHLNSIRKPIEKLARSKPPRKQISIDANKNGFLKPVRISPELAKFLGCSADEMKSRVQVTQNICKYISDNELQNPKNRREILVDSTLQNLLRFNPEVDGNLTYYQIQTYIQPHFLKGEVVA